MKSITNKEQFKKGVKDFLHLEARMREDNEYIYF